VKTDANAKVHFYRDDDGCPGQGEACATKPYLVAGDTVLVAQEVPGWSCVWYSGKKHEFVGWMPTKSGKAAGFTAQRSPNGPVNGMPKWVTMKFITSGKGRLTSTDRRPGMAERFARI
jgi:hypothetical protein